MARGDPGSSSKPGRLSALKERLALSRSFGTDRVRKKSRTTPLFPKEDREFAAENEEAGTVENPEGVAATAPDAENPRMAYVNGGSRAR